MLVKLLGTGSDIPYLNGYFYKIQFLLIKDNLASEYRCIWYVEVITGTKNVGSTSSHQLTGETKNNTQMDDLWVKWNWNSNLFKTKNEFFFLIMKYIFIIKISTKYDEESKKNSNTLPLRNNY